MTTINGITKDEWAEFLQTFSRRNQHRRARFQFFHKSAVREEGIEGHLESIVLEKDGEDAPRVIIKRRDESGATPQTLIQKVPHIQRIAVQFDTDGSEDALEFEDNQGSLVMLRLESKVDGVS